MYGSYSHTPSLNLVSEEESLLESTKHDTSQQASDTDRKNNGKKDPAVQPSSELESKYDHTSVVDHHPWTLTVEENHHDPETRRNDHESVLSLGMFEKDDGSNIFTSMLEASSKTHDDNDVNADHMPDFSILTRNSDKHLKQQRDRHSDIFPFRSSLPSEPFDPNSIKQIKNSQQTEVCAKHYYF